MFSTEKIKDWFEIYTEGFKVSGVLPRMLEMKKEHSVRVCEHCLMLADSMEWDDAKELWTAYAIGLLHDIGRFPQYAEYGTFLDSQSIDHGDLAEDILKKRLPRGEIPEWEMRCLLAAVKYHNKKDLPTNIPLGIYRWCALVRDADKIDIFHMVQQRIDNGTIFDMLPRHRPAKEISPALVEEISQTGKGSYSNARSLQDYRLIQLTWGCDLNFPASAEILREEGIFDRIAADLRPYGIDWLVDELLDRINLI